MSLLDSFDDSKIKCKECGKYFEKNNRPYYIPIQDIKTCNECIKNNIFNKFPYKEKYNKKPFNTV